MPVNPDAVGLKGEPRKRSWNSKDALLYALGVGAGIEELPFTTENTKDTPQRVLPTMGVVLGGGGVPFDKIGSFNPALMLHGAQSIELFGEIPAEGEIESSGHIGAIWDKGKGASVDLVSESVDVAVNLGVDPKKSDQAVRGSTVLPNGTGKTVRVAVFAQGEKADAATEAGADIVGMDDLAESIKGGELNFDVVIASPDTMRVVGKLGQPLLAVAVGEAGQSLLLLEHVRDLFLEGTKRHQAVNVDGSRLPDAMRAVGRLRLDRRIPPVVVVEDVRGPGQVEAGPPSPQRQQEDRRRVGILLEALHHRVACPGGDATVQERHLEPDGRLQVLDQELAHFDVLGEQQHAVTLVEHLLLAPWGEPTMP